MSIRNKLLEDILEATGAMGPPGPEDMFYDGLDTNVNIRSMSATTHLGEIWGANDIQTGVEAMTTSISGAPIDAWQSVTMTYNPITDSFRTPAGQQGDAVCIGEESYINAVNTEGVTATELNPLIFRVANATVGDTSFQDATFALAGSMANGDAFGINTNQADASGGKFRMLREGTANRVNTSAWALNDKLYVDSITPGLPTNIKPSTNAFYVGRVTFVSATAGSIYADSIGSQREDVDLVPVGIDRIHFTADEITPVATTFFEALRADSGTITDDTRTAVVPDDSKVGLAQDHLGIVLAQDGLIKSSLLFLGQIQASIDTAGGEERLIAEVYVADSDGVPENSGIVGEPVGDLGFTPIFTLESGRLNQDANDIFNAEVTGQPLEDFTVLAGKRIRFHIVCEKIGVAGGNKTFTVYFGSDRRTYINAPQLIDSDDVLNVSNVPGATVTAALNELHRPISVVLVESLADLPTPAAGLIPAANNTVYDVRGFVSISPNRIDLGTGQTVAFIGRTPTQDGLSTNNVGDLFTGTDPIFVCSKLDITCDHPYAVTQISGANVFINDCQFFDYLTIGTFTNTVFVEWQNNFFLAGIGSTGGITYIGACGLLRHRTFQVQIHDRTFIDMTDEGMTFADFDVIGWSYAIDSDDPLMKIIAGLPDSGNASVANNGYGIVDGTITHDFGSMVGPPEDIFTDIEPGDRAWWITNTPDVVDSSFLAQLLVPTNVLETDVTDGAYVDVNTSLGVVLPGSQRFVINGNNALQADILQRQASVRVDFSVFATTVGGGTQNYRFALFRDVTQISNDYPIELKGSSAQSTGFAIVSVADLQKLIVRVWGVGTGVDIVVSNLSLLVSKA